MYQNYRFSFVRVLWVKAQKNEEKGDIGKNKNKQAVKTRTVKKKKVSRPIIKIHKILWTLFQCWRKENE